MSIASEIQDLNTNLTAAKNAVTTKGGTVGDTGLAGLAAEIASIPSGGSISSYGTIKYTENGVDKTVEMVTEEDFLKLTLGNNSSVVLNINNTNIAKTWIKEVIVGDDVQYLPDQFCYLCDALTKVTLPTSIHYIGDGAFWYTAVNSPLELSNVRYIGSSFLRSVVTFNQPINLPNVAQIGTYFLSDCTNFNSAVTLNDNTVVIGERFLNGCSNFAQPFSIPSGLITIGTTKNPGQRFMYNCNSFTGPLACNSGSNIPSDAYALSTTDSTAVSYTTGVTLTGSYANAWKTSLSDRSLQSPYRKLIVAS